MMAANRKHGKQVLDGMIEAGEIWVAEDGKSLCIDVENAQGVLANGAALFGEKQHLLPPSIAPKLD